MHPLLYKSINSGPTLPVSPYTGNLLPGLLLVLYQIHSTWTQSGGERDTGRVEIHFLVARKLAMFGEEGDGGFPALAVLLAEMVCGRTCVKWGFCCSGCTTKRRDVALE